MKKLKEMRVSVYDIKMIHYDCYDCTLVEKLVDVVEFFMIDNAYKFYERFFIDSWTLQFMSPERKRRFISKIEHFGIF